ncbi:MAG: hypothetical protein IKE58_01185 [Blautia sp.]|nr:hypothetical protein [Blautia sp.]
MNSKIMATIDFHVHLSALLFLVIGIKEDFPFFVFLPAISPCFFFSMSISIIRLFFWGAVLPDGGYMDHHIGRRFRKSFMSWHRISETPVKRHTDQQMVLTTCQN